MEIVPIIYNCRAAKCIENAEIEHQGKAQISKVFRFYIRTFLFLPEYGQGLKARLITMHWGLQFDGSGLKTTSPMILLSHGAKYESREPFTRKVKTEVETRRNK